MAAQSSLGALRADFRPSLRARWLDLAFVPLFPLLAVMVAVVALETSPRQRAEGLTLAWITAAVSLAIAALFIWRSWRRRGLRAALHAERIVLDNQMLTDLERLGDEIVRESTARILPASIQALERGDRLSFGPLAIDVEGLHTAPRSIPWSAVSAIEIEDGQLSVVQLGKGLAWCRFEVAELANFCVLMPLLDQRSVLPEAE